MQIKPFLLAAAVTLCAPVAQAQDFPTKPVRLIVPLTPGSGADIAARLLGKRLSELWGQPVVVDNRPGAGGQIGTQAVTRSAPDGYTLLVQSASHAANPAIYKTLPYDPLKDFVDVAILGTSPYVLITAAEGPHKTLPDLIQAAKARPDTIAFASAGVGTSTHLAAETFVQRAGARLVHIPFKGSPDAINDVAGVRSAFYMAPYSTVVGQLKDGKLRALAVTTPKRFAGLPDVPTVAEQGFPGFRSELWVGLWAPTGTPAGVLEKLHGDIERAYQGAEMNELVAKAGFDVQPMTSDDFARFVRAEMALNKQVVKAANIEMQ